jgi:hypothetical protein
MTDEKLIAALRLCVKIDADYAISLGRKPQTVTLEGQAADRLAALIEEREASLGETARLVGIIDFMTAANAMTQDAKLCRRDIGPDGPDPFGGRFK